MNVDTMRKVDYHAGVPLCFLATYLKKLFQLIRPSEKRDPKNVLLIELSEMGSAILVDPAMEELKKRGANLHFLIFAKNKVSLQLLNTVPEENIFTIREDSIRTVISDTLGFLSWARKKNIDSVIDLELFSRFTALLSGYCGADNVVGYYRFHNEGLYRGEMLTKKVAYNPHVHITKNFFSLVHALYTEEDEVPYSKIKLEDKDITLKKAVITEEQTHSVKEKIKTVYEEFESKKIVLINANASDLLPQRRWEQENFIALIQQILSAHDDVLVLLTGAPTEREGLQNIPDRVSNPRCINFAGNVKFLELPALYALSTCMVTNDSGPGHFSSVTDMHTFVLFGPETPDLYHSLGNSTPIYAGLNCSPCVSAWNHRKTECSDNRCLQALTPEMVYNLVMPKLV